MSMCLKVLVVDDEPKLCQLLEQIIRSQGCLVRTALNGLEALTRFQEQPAEVIITDLKMPQLDGLSLIRELKRRDPLVNIVVITAYPSVEGAVEAMQCGACDFIMKPFDLAQVQAILYRCHQRLTLTRQVRHREEGLVKLEELNRRLTELNDLKSQFLAALSHGVNTPLCIMGESIYLLSEGQFGTLTDDQQQAVGAVVKAYERLHRLLQQLIDLMQGGQLVLSTQQVTVQELVREALDAVMPKAKGRWITVTCQVPDEPLPLQVDRVRMVAAFEYILDNAIKCSHDHGRVDIQVTPTDERAQVWIRDTGIGIPPEECEKVFAPFYQIHHHLKGIYEGVGIGLTLAKRYLELHGGCLELSSEVGKGTIVMAALPRRVPLVTPSMVSANPLS
jgi:signal transduction histidine kinase